MPQQIELPGFEPAPDSEVVEHSLFFAMLPDAATAARIRVLAERLRAQHGLQDKLLYPEHLHVTLQALQSTKPTPPRPQLIEVARQVAATIVSPPFDIVFDHALRFGRPADRNRALVLQSGDGSGVVQLTAFQQRLGTALAQRGLRLPRPPDPHMTLLYTSRHVAKQPIEPLRWTTTTFTLVHSYVGETRHEHLGIWPLNG